jgi:hypothetical protein
MNNQKYVRPLLLHTCAYNDIAYVQISHGVYKQEDSLNIVNTVAALCAQSFEETSVPDARVILVEATQEEYDFCCKYHLTEDTWGFWWLGGVDGVKDLSEIQDHYNNFTLSFDPMDLNQYDEWDLRNMQVPEPQIKSIVIAKNEKYYGPSEY